MLKKALISEKSMALAKQGLYTFVISSKINKVEITKLVERQFKVNVIAVKTINVKGKVKNQRTRKGTYTMPDVRKAMVQLKAGQKIALFEAATTEASASVTTAENVDAKAEKPKEKKSLLSGTKVKIEKMADQKEASKAKETKKGDKGS